MKKVIEKDGKYYQEFKVVMLPTDKESAVFLKTDGLLDCRHYPAFQENRHLGVKYQQIYFLSDDKVNVGDFVYDFAHDKISKFNGLVVNGGNFSDHAKKIIATTDDSLELECSGYQSFPQPSFDFLEHYVESYNNGKKINDALIEVNLLCCQTGINCGFPCNGDCTIIAVPELKVDKNNVISIKKINDKWNDIFQEYLKENPTFDNDKVSFLSYLEDNFNPPIKK
jgi:hypothetical protein